MCRGDRVGRDRAHCDRVPGAGPAHGLVTGFGDAGSVGIGGITLGGGVGFLVRKHGLTIDSLLAAELVTADGEVVTADEDTNPDLFWAIRGGGGNFGVATRLHVRLHPVDAFVGGMMILPATRETIAGFIAESEAAPEELSTIANVMNCPPMPFVPDEVVGTMVIMALIAWTGPEDQGLEMMERFRSLGEPLADMTASCPSPGSTCRRTPTTNRWRWLAPCSPTISTGRRHRPSSIT